MNGLLDRIAAPYRRDARRDARASLPAYQRGVMLSQPQSYQSLLGVPSIQIPTAPAAPSSSLAMLDALQRPEVAERLDRQRQEDDFSMRRRLGLLQDVPPPEPRPSMPQDTFLGRLGGGIKSAAQEIGGLFEGEEGRARAAALSRSLLRGPSRTPISLGQSVAEGLAAGGEEIERQALRKAKMEQLERSSKREKQKDEALDVLAKKDATQEEVLQALRIIDPSSYAKAVSKNKSLSQVKADFLQNLKEKNPEEFKRLVTKSIEGSVNPFAQKIYGSSPDSGLPLGSEFSTNKEANDAAKAAGKDTYVFEGKTYRTQ